MRYWVPGLGYGVEALAMMANPIFSLVLPLALLLTQSASAQLSFDVVRKQAKNSGSEASAIKILMDFVDAESTSAGDQVRALEYLARYPAARGNSKRANEFVVRGRELAESQPDRELIRNVLQIESAITNNLSEFQRGIDAATRCIEITECINLT